MLFVKNQRNIFFFFSLYLQFVRVQEFPDPFSRNEEPNHFFGDHGKKRERNPEHVEQRDGDEDLLGRQNVLFRIHEDVGGEDRDRNEDRTGRVCEIDHGPVDGVEFEGPEMFFRKLVSMLLFSADEQNLVLEVSLEFSIRRQNMTKIKGQHCYIKF